MHQDRLGWEARGWEGMGNGLGFEICPSRLHTEQERTGLDLQFPHDLPVRVSLQLI